MRTEQIVLQKIKNRELLSPEEVFEAIKLRNKNKVSDEEVLRVIPVLAGG